MPTGLTGGFDLVFAISARTFGAIAEGTLRPLISSLGTTGRDIPIPAAPGRPASTLFFDDMRVEAWTGTTTGNTIEMRLAFFNARIVAGPITVSLGPNWSDFTFPATPSVIAAGAGAVNLVLTNNFAATVFDADDESLLAPPLPTEADIAAALGPALTGAGVANPMVLTPTPIPTVPQAPAAAPGIAPGLAAMAVAVQRRTGPGAVGEEAVAMLMNFQNRPNTPAGRGLGNPALVPFSSFGVGQDLLLEIENAFLLETIATTALEGPVAGGGLGIPPGALTVTRGAGITLGPAVGLTLSGTPGLLTALTITPPTAGTTALTLGLTFVFTRDDITYTVTVAGATMTIALSGTTIVVGNVIPAPTVTYTAPWYIYLRDFVIGAVTGAFIAGVPGLIIGGVVGGLRVFIEASIVSAIVGPSAAAGVAGALGGAGGGLIPAALTGLTGGATLSPPLVFDDLQVGARVAIPDVIQEYRRVAAIEIAPGGWLNLEAGNAIKGALRDRNRFLEVFHQGGSAADADLIWDAQGLHAGANAQLVRMNGRFSATAYSDAADALSSGVNTTVDATQIPRVTASALAAQRIPSGTLVAVRTNVGRVAKVLAWRDEEDRLTVRYVVWDTSAAAFRIFPRIPQWTHTRTENRGEVAGPLEGQKTTTYWYASRAVFTGRTHQMTMPVTYKWSLAGVNLAGTGSSVLAGASVRWTAAGAQLTLELDLGESLHGATLGCTASDTNNILVSESVQLDIPGREDVTSYDRRHLAIVDSVIESWRAWREELVSEPVRPPVGPDPSPEIELRIKTAFLQAKVPIVEREFQIR